jgi:hypothetical protein
MGSVRMGKAFRDSFSPPLCALQLKTAFRLRGRFLTASSQRLACTHDACRGMRSSGWRMVMRRQTQSPTGTSIVNAAPSCLSTWARTDGMGRRITGLRGSWLDRSGTARWAPPRGTTPSTSTRTTLRMSDGQRALLSLFPMTGRAAFMRFACALPRLAGQLSFVPALLHHEGRAGRPDGAHHPVAVGHKRTGMTLGRYSGGPLLEQARRCVEAVKLP